MARFFSFIINGLRIGFFGWSTAFFAIYTACVATCFLFRRVEINR